MNIIYSRACEMVKYQGVFNFGKSPIANFTVTSFYVASLLYSQCINIINFRK